MNTIRAIFAALCLTIATVLPTASIANNDLASYLDALGVQYIMSEQYPHTIVIVNNSFDYSELCNILAAYRISAIVRNHQSGELCISY